MSDLNLGEELRQRRGTRSLRQMAELCGVDFSTLSRIEKGKIDLPARDKLNSISLGYGFPMEYLAQLVYCGRQADPECERG